MCPDRDTRACWHPPIVMRWEVCTFLGSAKVKLEPSEVVVLVGYVPAGNRGHPCRDT